MKTGEILRIDKLKSRGRDVGAHLLLGEKAIEFRGSPRLEPQRFACLVLTGKGVEAVLDHQEEASGRDPRRELGNGLAL